MENQQFQNVTLVKIDGLHSISFIRCIRQIIN